MSESGSDVESGLSSQNDFDVLSHTAAFWSLVLNARKFSGLGFGCKYKESQTKFGNYLKRSRVQTSQIQ